MAKGLRHLTTNIAEMILDTPYPDGDFDAVVVRKFVEVEPGKDTLWTHDLGRMPNRITVIHADRAINYPEVVSMDASQAVLRFVPEWVSTYTSRKALITLEFA